MPRIIFIFISKDGQKREGIDADQKSEKQVDDVNDADYREDNNKENQASNVLVIRVHGFAVCNLLKCVRSS